MSHWTRRPRSPLLNPEFSRAVPTNGFGEIEAKALASLSSPGAPRPRPATPTPARKVCRISSPISSTRPIRDGHYSSLFMGQPQQHARPHTADVPYRPRIEASPTTGEKNDIHIYNNSNSNSTSNGNGVDSRNNRNNWDAIGSGGRSASRRPVTSDSSSGRRAWHLQHHQQFQGVNDIGGGGERAGVDGGVVGTRGGGGELRPSTSGRGIKPRGGLDGSWSSNNNGPGGVDGVPSRSWIVAKDQREWRGGGVDQQAGRHGAQDSTRQRQPVNPTTSTTSLRRY